MSRRERLRAYWEERIPPSASLYLSDVARFTDGVVSLRTLQRRALDGALAVIGGKDRAVREYRVLREDLLDFLCDLDSITGHEPPQPRPKRPPERASRPPAQPKQKPERAARPRTEQGTLFD